MRLLIEQDLAADLLRSRAVRGLNEIVGMDPSSAQGEMAKKVLEGLLA